MTGPRPEGDYVSKATSYEVKYHLVLAERLKDTARASPGLTPGDTAEFLANVERERARLSAAPAQDLDLIIGGKNASRLRRYNSAAWTKEEVDLESCLVADGMGRKPWVRGLKVPEAASVFLSREGEKSRVSLMKSRTQLFLKSFPIIVLAAGAQSRIDDGSHRAVAAWLAGYRTVPGFIGRA